MAHYKVYVHTVCATLSEIVQTLRIPQLGKNIGGNRFWAPPVDSRGLGSPKCEDNFFTQKKGQFLAYFQKIIARQWIDLKMHAASRLKGFASVF